MIVIQLLKYNLQMKKIINFTQLTILIIVYTLSHAYQIPLTRVANSSSPQYDAFYVFDVNHNKQQYKLMANLGQQENWMINSECQVCDGEECLEKCAENVGANSKGVTCNQKFCSDKENPVNNSQLQGKTVEMYFTLGKKSKEQFNATLVLVEKFKMKNTDANKKFDGVINLFHAEESQFLFNQFSILYPQKYPMILVQQTPSKYVVKHNNQISLELSEDYSFNATKIVVGQQEVQTNSNVYFSLTSKQILLPKTVYDDFFKSLIQELGKNCTFNKQVLSCKGGVDLTKVKSKILKIGVNSQELAFPLEAFIKNCKKNGCTFSISKSQDDNIILGQIVYANFAVTFDLQKKSVSFSRLDNSWGEKFSKIDPTLALKQSRVIKFFKWIILSFFKLVLILGIIAVLINCYYNRSTITKWFKKMNKDKQQKYTPAFQEQIDYTSNFVKGYDAQKATKQFWQQNSVEGI